MSHNKNILALLLNNTLNSEYTEYSVHGAGLGTVLPSSLTTTLAESLDTWELIPQYAYGIGTS